MIQTAFGVQVFLLPNALYMIAVSSAVRGCESACAPLDIITHCQV